MLLAFPTTAAIDTYYFKEAVVPSALSRSGWPAG